MFEKKFNEKELLEKIFERLHEKKKCKIKIKVKEKGTARGTDYTHKIHVDHHDAGTIFSTIDREDEEQDDDPIQASLYYIKKALDSNHYLEYKITKKEKDHAEITVKGTK